MGCQPTDNCCGFCYDIYSLMKVQVDVLKSYESTKLYYNTYFRNLYQNGHTVKLGSAHVSNHGVHVWDFPSGLFVVYSLSNKNSNFSQTSCLCLLGKKVNNAGVWFEKLVQLFVLKHIKNKNH